MYGLRNSPRDLPAISQDRPAPRPLPLRGKMKADILVPSTWKKYRPSMCHNCQAGCCTLPVTVDSEDLFHMGYIEATQVNGPLKKIAKRLMSQGIVKTYRDRSRTFVLQ